MSSSYESFLLRLDGYDARDPPDQHAQYGYLLALYDEQLITLDELEDLRARIGLSADEADDIQV